VRRVGTRVEPRPDPGRQSMRIVGAFRSPGARPVRDPAVARTDGSERAAVNVARALERAARYFPDKPEGQ
jgi:hypothetical protein